jgi:GSH-dependent disulfide-bond oxidoreductase
VITLYTWKTPNGRKPAIMLEELGWDYEAKPIDISKDEQFARDFLKISPNNKIPAIVDGELSIFESGAILTYLAEKSGQFLAPSGDARFKALEWLHWQIGGLGPMLGQLGWFLRQPEKLPPAVDRYRAESTRLIRVMNTRLAEAEYLGGDYSIADIACYPWMVAATTMLKEPLGEALDQAPALHAWLDRVGARPAVQKGMAVLT